ncbi:hypothetical protein SAMN00120144_2284 [Hymenobacter roseosalivarius DSM 11622]|uniref:Uncharacterized protein n=1 Tax=Hymenobacter roseosalivarius DSM 11622 TaxID=645990 RepID=A0A1W1VXX6_9BACT|nr:hypothetical protein [Hymenobacter roseosalivarius]SMB97941.1 hypothetical protein SAMN00120144_2284 [Hymenobacter roseosalivarius DSM 11622]
MNEDLRLSLANNAKQWLALSLSISSAEKVVFKSIHDGFLASHGPEFMVHVYRTTFEQALESMPDAERNKLLYTFREAMDKAIDEHHDIAAA